jgi:hypothetical protein
MPWNNYSHDFTLLFASSMNCAASAKKRFGSFPSRSNWSKMIEVRRLIRRSSSVVAASG